MDIYHSKRWEKKRKYILRRDGYMCQESKRYGKIVPADTVHHIFPVEHFPQFAWCNWNLISLCNKEHNAMHDRNTHDLTRKGLDLLKKTASKQGIEI